MSEIKDISSILQESLLLKNNSIQSSDSSNRLQKVKTQLQNLPNVLDESTLTKLKDGEYEITLEEYTNMNSYNTMMTALYGNKSANQFQNTLNLLTNSSDDELATAKKFVDKMKESGMSNTKAVKTYTALKRYSLFSSFGNYSFVKAKI